MVGVCVRASVDGGGGGGGGAGQGRLDPHRVARGGRHPPPVRAGGRGEEAQRRGDPFGGLCEPRPGRVLPNAPQDGPHRVSNDCLPLLVGALPMEGGWGRWRGGGGTADGAPTSPRAIHRHRGGDTTATAAATAAAVAAATAATTIHCRPTRPTPSPHVTVGCAGTRTRRRRGLPRRRRTPPRRR
ncbi:hypothetical protein I4F81_007741 [Pyropia yezoensis]|uniref:Uncharacterized protein n=1 Tax=Pyropia yezoensis TaxID=2788 RepID=A0ACC3C4W4_PYRYE|nr:hypothetical protein I4F81_007741 [Neopyropia yezoensis]